MQITKIERQKKDEQRFSVFVDNKFAFGLSGIDLLYHKLEEGIELSPEKYNYIIEESVFSKAKDRAVKFLSYRMRSRKELYDKLNDSKYDFTEDIINRTIDIMEKYGYIDDFKFSVAYIKDKSNINGFGNIRIKHELLLKGVDKDIIEKAMLDTEMDEGEIALNLINKRYKTKKFIDIKDKKKAYDFLLRKGFSYEIINSTLNLFIEAQD